MGGKKKTEQTFEQVEQNLLKQLYTNARTLLESGKPEIPDKPTFDDLDTIAAQVAKQNFKAKYGYEYDGQKTKPNPPPADGKEPLASNGIASYSSVDDAIITGYVTDRILAGVALTWPRKSAQADLEGLGKRLFKDTTNRSWVVQPFQKNYQNQDSKDDEFEFRADGIFVFTNSQLIIDGQDVKIVVLAYVGVWYNVSSRLKASRDYLLEVMLKNAKTLQPIAEATAGNETQRLEKILAPYAPAQFKGQFHYDFNTNSTKPPDLIAGTTPYIRGAQIFAIPSSNELEAVTDYVKTHILNAMDLPAFLRDHDGEHGLALTDLSDELKSLLSTSTDNAWLTVPFDKVYENPDDGQHSIRTSATFVFTNGKATINGIEVVQFYALYCGVFYQINSPYLAARAALFKTLIERAKQLAPNFNPPAIDSPELQLRAILEQYGKSEFKERIGFDYNADPSDLAPKKLVRRVSTLLHMDLAGGPITEEVVKRRVKGIVSNVYMDKWVQDLALGALTEYVFDITKEAVLNSYNSNPSQRQFNHPTAHVLDWNLRGIFTYANGQDFDGGRQYKSHIVHLFFIIYPTTDSLDSASLPAAASREVTVDDGAHGAEEGNFRILAF